LFDILKPSLIGWADKKNGSLGVMLDDIFAGIAAAICTILLAAVYHGI
jgi:phosphatidylglycerophosphatase A